MTKRNSIAEMKEEVAGWRRELHMNPGIKHEEEFANQFIKARLDDIGIPYKDGYGGYGIVATIEGRQNTSGKTVGLRADIDALPITEEGDKPWVSKIDGKMHACGHDGHTATVLGVAKYLAETRNFDGKVHLIFQPAEEGGQGAEKMIADGLFKDFPCDVVYAFHNWPFLQKGKAAIRPGPFMASSDEFHLTIRGKGGHAALPHGCVDPIVIAAQIITTAQSLVSRQTDPIEPSVISFTDLHGGEGACNVIPDTVTLKGTIRTFNETVRQNLHAGFKRCVESICAMNGADFNLDLIRNLDATINDANEAEFCANIAASILGEENINRNEPPCMGGEDFGAMIEDRPGAYIWIGQGEDDPNSPHSQGLHTPRYDFNDEILPTTIEYMAELVETKLKCA